MAKRATLARLMQTLATEPTPPVGALREDGSLDPAHAEALSEELAIALYEQMVLARELDERLIALQREGRIGSHASAIGEEAAIVGAAAAMRDEDWVFLTSREMAAAMWRGAPLFACAHHVFGTARSAGKGRSSHVPPFWKAARVASVSPLSGTQIPHAVGVAWAARLRKDDVAALVFFGEGATSSGDLHPARNVAGGTRAPVIAVCRNNGWATSTPASRQTASAGFAIKAVGYGLRGVCVDGADVVAVLSVVRAARLRAAAGEGGTLIEAVTTPRQDREAVLGPSGWSDRDPIARMRASPRVARLDEPRERRAARRRAARGRRRGALRGRRRGGALEGIDVRGRVRGAALASSRAARRGRQGSIGSEIVTQKTMVQAINDALRLEMRRDDRVVVLGEDVGKVGGVFRVTQGLWDEFGDDRVVDTPLSEAGIMGCAIGMALYGLVPVPEIQFADFIYPAYDQIVSELAKLRWRSGGEYPAKLVVRTPVGGGIRGGLYHSQSPESLFIHIAGLKVVCPSTPHDAKGLLLASIRDPDPVLFFEPKRIYRAAKGDVPEGDYTVPLGQAAIVRAGTDVTVLAWGAMLYEAVAAADEAQKQGVECEILDLRTLWPVDIDAILASVKKTGRLVVVHEAPKTCGFGAELVTLVTERAFVHLEAPPVRVCGFDTPFPYSLEMEYLPLAHRILPALVETAQF